MTGEQLKSTVNQLFQTIKERSNNTELTFICPEPGCGDQSGNRSVNLKTGATNCWRCNKGGDFIRWARRLGYVLEDSTPMAVPAEKIVYTGGMRQKQALPPVLEIKMPVGFTPCAEQPASIYTTLIGEMALRKNLLLEDFLEAGVGFTRCDRRWEPYAIFPVYEYDQIVYFQGRTYVDPEDGPTKLFPSRREAEFGARYWVYNIDEIKRVQPPIVLVVESILNVLSLRWYLREQGVRDVVPVAVFKHYVSAQQAQKLLAHACVKELCLLYDHDASQSSWDKAPLLASSVRLSIAEMPLGLGGARTDPNDDVVLAFDAFEKRTRYDSKRALVRKLEVLPQLKRTQNASSSEKRYDVLGMTTRLLEKL